MEIVVNEHQRGDKLKRLHSERTDKVGSTLMFEGKNIHSSPVDGKLLCSYSEKVCMQRRLNGFAFCIRHILEDKDAPFKQCQFFAKYNKSRCINPVPILEKRDYCNSHMQVLGIIPKKLKKKKDCNGRIQANLSQEDNLNTVKSLAHKDYANGKSCTQPKNHGVSLNQTNTTNCKTNVKTDKSSQRESRNPVKKVMPPLKWASPSHLLKKLVKRQKTGKTEREEAISDPTVRHYSHLYRRNEVERKDLFRIYMFEGVEDEVSDFEDLPLQSNSTEDLIIFRDEFAEEDISIKLKHQTSQLKQSIKTRLEDRNMTYSVLQSLVNAAKANTVQTATFLKSVEDHKSFRGKRCAKSNMRCAATLIPNERCSKSALPYARHCIKHISNDEDQVLYGKCTARFSAGSQCCLPVFDLLNERPLCAEHSMIKMNSATNEASLPAKRLKRPEKLEKNRGKVPSARKNLKAQLQKKFAIPNMPMKKSNSHIGNSIIDEEKTAPDKKHKLKMTFKASTNSKWMLRDCDNDGEKSEGDVVMPRPYADAAACLSPSSSDLTFDINTESLSPPLLMSEEEDRYPLMNMGRRHHDSFTFDDDEDLLQSNAFAMNRATDNRDIRGITSPPLTQFSAEPLGDLCSPAKLTLEKRLFDSTSVLKQEATATGFNPVSITRGGSFRSDGIIPSQNALMSDDRYSIGDANSTNSVTLSSSLNSLSSTSETWATKFTLPTRNDQLPVTSGGFIRVDPSSHNNIYSPPFTSPPSRVKADIFKFENSSKQLESDTGVPTRDLPSYATAVCGLERKFDVEPPLQKVNPDIFLSTMYTVPESSNT